MTASLRIGIIGGNGWIGGALARAAVAARLLPEASLCLSYRTTKPSWLPGAAWTRDNQALADRSDVIVVSVRPADWPAVNASGAGKLVISVMAGVPIVEIDRRLQAPRVVRALPNAAAEVAASYTPWVASSGVTADDRSLVRRIFDACGTQDEVAREEDLDFLTGLSGSGPAFPALLATAMMRAAVDRGLSPELARRAVGAVLIGAGRLLEKHGEDPARTVDTFVEYAGTTAAAIEAMRAAGFDAAVAAGLAAAFRKASSLGSGG